MSDTRIGYRTFNVLLYLHRSGSNTNNHAPRSIAVHLMLDETRYQSTANGHFYCPNDEKQ